MELDELNKLSLSDLKALYDVVEKHISERNSLKFNQGRLIEFRELISGLLATKMWSLIIHTFQIPEE